MATFDKINEEAAFLSNRLSEQTRTIAVGVLALVWIFVAAGDKPPIEVPPGRGVLVAAASLAIGSMLLDYMQYLFGYLATRRVLDEAERSLAKEAQFNYESTFYKARGWFFWGKQGACVAAVLLLLWAVVKGALGIP